MRMQVNEQAGGVNRRSCQSKEDFMSQVNIAVIIGSLRRDSFNAKLAGAIAKLAPADFTFKNSQIGDLPLTGLAFCYAGIQSFNSRRPQERNRPRLAALRTKRVCRQASWCDRGVG